METQTINFVKLIEYQTWVECVNRQAWMASQDNALDSNLQAPRARRTGQPAILLSLRHIFKVFRPDFVRP